MATPTPFRPGPWYRMPHVDASALSLTVIDANGDVVARTHGWCGEPDHAEGTANLIAAAPELIAAIQFALDEDNDWRACREELRKALAKAEGRS